MRSPIDRAVQRSAPTSASRGRARGWCGGETRAPPEIDNEVVLSELVAFESGKNLAPDEDPTEEDRTRRRLRT